MTKLPIFAGRRRRFDKRDIPYAQQETCKVMGSLIGTSERAPTSHQPLHLALTKLPSGDVAAEHKRALVTSAGKAQSETFALQDRPRSNGR